MLVGTLLVLELFLLLQHIIIRNRYVIDENLKMYYISKRAERNITYWNNSIMTNISQEARELTFPQMRTNPTKIPMLFDDNNGDYLPLMEYFINTKRNLLIKFKPKENLMLADHIGSMRGIILFSIINNANFCTDDIDYLKYMDNSLSILKCGNVTIKDYWNESYAIQWIKKHDCLYHINKNTEITASYDLSVHISHCDSFIDNLQIYANQLNTKKYTETITKLLFQPQQRILINADEVMSRLNHHSIGIDIYFNKENQLITQEITDNMESSLSIQRIIQKLSEYDDSYSVYISSNIPKLLSSFKIVKKNIIFSKDIGLKSPSSRDIEYEQDALNIWILSQCNVLIYTSQSRNGEIAREITKINEIFVINV